jgi:hypothetical protein
MQRESGLSHRELSHIALGETPFDLIRQYAQS